MTADAIEAIEGPDLARSAHAPAQCETPRGPQIRMAPAIARRSVDEESCATVRCCHGDAPLGRHAGRPTGQVKDFKPVTDAMLLNPDPADWPNWRRTLDGWGYSPLKQINTQNVHQLQLAWSWGLSAGPEPADAARRRTARCTCRARAAACRRSTPRTATCSGSTRARRGRRRAREPRRCATWPSMATRSTSPRPTRASIALNARTGAVAWDHQVADTKLGYTYSSGPIVVKGMIVAGITGCQRYKNDVCFISAHDSQTGKELWRTSTIARPGRAGRRHVGRSAADVPRRRRRVDSRQLRSRRPTSFTGAPRRPSRGPASPAAPTATRSTPTARSRSIRRPARSSGTTSTSPARRTTWTRASSASSSTLRGRSSVFTMGKLGILWELDRKTGAFLSAHDLALSERARRRSRRPARRPIGRT